MSVAIQSTTKTLNIRGSNKIDSWENINTKFVLKPESKSISQEKQNKAVNQNNLNALTLTQIFYFSILNILDNLRFFLFLGINAVLTKISNTPRQFFNLKREIEQLVLILINQHSREVWILKWSLQKKLWLQNLSSFFARCFRLIQKSYLAILIVFMVVFLNSSILIAAKDAISNTNDKSTLALALDNHSQVAEKTLFDLDSNEIVSLSFISQNAEENENAASFLNQIQEHEVKEGETLEMIAENYGVTTETIAFNNQIEDDKALPEKLFIPWKDGYIYRAEEDILIKELEKIYGLSVAQIYQDNESNFDHEKDGFLKDTYVFLSTTDFKAVDQANIAEKERKEEEKRKREEQERQKELAVAARNRRNKAVVTSNQSTYAGTFSSAANSAGFIWPAQGSISRCVVGNHIACDIANPSSPPLYAVQNATVAAVYRYTVTGYGLAVLLDHGNGLQTLYAHMSEIYVTPGQSVSQGQSIGRMGCTGYCFGTHVHFEVRVNGVKQDPLIYLP